MRLRLEKKKKKRRLVATNISHFQSVSGGDMLKSSFLEPFTGALGQDVSCKLKKGI